jgi:hypothetical protein
MMKKLTRLYYYSFTTFLLIFLIPGIYLGDNQAHPLSISIMYAIGIILALDLIIIFILNIQHQGFLDRENAIWSLLFVFIWLTIWRVSIWFGAGLKKRSGCADWLFGDSGYRPAL